MGGRSETAVATGANAERWKEELPEANCPPSEAQAANCVVLRLVPEDPVKPEHFESHAAQGKKMPRRLDACRWAACSVYVESVRPEVLEGLAKLPTLSHMKFIAYIQLDEKAGVLCPHPDKPEHLSFWMYDSFAPHKAVVKLVPL